MLKRKFKSMLRAFALPVVAIAFCCVNARAEIEAYMRLGIPSGKTRPVGVDVVDKSEPTSDGWFPITFSAHSITAATSWLRGGGASIGKPTPGDFSFTKNINFASPSLLSALVTGRNFNSAELVVRNGNDPTGPFYAVKLQTVFVVQLSPSSVAGVQRATENVSVVYRAIEWSYHNFGASGEIAFSSTVNWDVPNGTFQQGPIANLAPLTLFADSDQFVRFPGQSLTIPLWNLLSNDAPDAGFDKLSSTTTELGGTVSVQNGQIQYRPPSSDPGGPDHFTYSVQNFAGDRTQAVVTIAAQIVTPPNIVFQLNSRGSTLLIPAEAGLHYQLEITDALGAAWTPFGSVITPTSAGPLAWNGLPQDGTHFYRIAILP
jgi:type VI secretion system secreted protein Hcp